MPRMTYTERREAIEKFKRDMAAFERDMNDFGARVDAFSDRVDVVAAEVQRERVTASLLVKP